MGNKDILNLLNDKEFQRTLVGTYKCLKTSLREELQDVEDSIIISYLKAYIIYEYEKIEDIEEKREFITSLEESSSQELYNNFIESINGIMAKMGDLVDPEVLLDLRELLPYKSDEIYKELSKDNKSIAKIIAKKHGYHSIKSLKKRAEENPNVKSYFEHIISEEELKIIDYAKEGFFFPNYIAHMLFDEKSYFYHCDHNINNDSEILKNAILNTNEDNPRLDIVYPDGIIVEYHMGDIRIKRYTFHQIVEFTKLYLAKNFSEILSQYESPNCPVIYGAPIDTNKLATNMILNSFVIVQDMLEAYNDVYTQKKIDEYKKIYTMLKETSKKYNL